MKKKFFERTFLLTLLLFLLFLNGGIFALAYYTHSNSVSAAEQVCMSEEFYIIEAFENDLASVIPSNEYLLQVSYGNFYMPKGIYLQFTKNGKLSFSTLPEGLNCPEEGLLEGGKVGGKRFMLITESVGDSGYLLTYAKDVSYLDEEFKSLALVFAAASVAASVLLALFLYLLLRRLYTPLDQLRVTTAGLAAGDFGIRADESGGDEFSVLAKDINTMADTILVQMTELTNTANRRQRMLDNLAHEMRTPLTSIHGYAEYITAAKVSEEDKIEAAQFIMSEAMRLRTISEILLDTAFVRENKINPSNAVVRELLLGTRDRLHAAAHKKSVRIECVGGDFVMEADTALLELLLANLCDNAVKACGEGGRVELGAYEENEKKILYVRDNGKGMTPEQIIHITEPFYRTDKARSRRDGGTGLGLALCEQIAAAHGAALTFESEVGKGTTAFVIF